MADLSAHDTIRQSYDPIHDIGSIIYLSPDTFARAAEWGWSNPFSFYFAGRGGVLGDVGASVVAATFGWFNPDIVNNMFPEGAAVAGARGAAERIGTEVDGRTDVVDRVVGLADGVVGAELGHGVTLSGH